MNSRRSNILTALRRRYGSWAAGYVLLCAPLTAFGAGIPESVSPGELVTNIHQLRALAVLPTNVLCTVNCEGVVFWASPARDTFVLNGEDLGGMRVEMDLRNYPPLQLGQKVRLEGKAVAGHGSLRQTFVDNDGLHPAVETSESIYLPAGRQPIQVDWFNGRAAFVLQVDYAASGQARHPIPDSALTHSEASTNGATPYLTGLEYHCYEGFWRRLPDFEQMQPVTSGTASNFTLDGRTQDQEVGLQFKGFLQVPHSGMYTFWLRSDDGARLYFGDARLKLSVEGTTDLPVGKQLAGGEVPQDRQWLELEGAITALRRCPSGQFEAELNTGEGRAHLELGNSAARPPGLFSRIRATGVYHSLNGPPGKWSGRLLVASWRQIDAPPNETNAAIQKTNSLAELRQDEPEIEGGLRPLHLEGVLLAVGPDWLALQDQSGAALVQMDLTGVSLKPGQKVIVEGMGSVMGPRVHMGSAVVEADGVHEPIERSGSVFLRAGKRPLHLSWFNREGPSALQVFYEGPGLPREGVPESALFHARVQPGTNGVSYVSGLNYRCYEGSWWQLPDPGVLQPAEEGIATNFSLSYVTRPRNVGLEFSGLLEVPRDGFYTFWTRSDDGCRLFIGDDVARITVGDSQPVPVPTRIEPRQLLRREQEVAWCQAEGIVTFASEEPDGFGLELTAETGRMHVHVPDSAGASPLLLLNSRVRVMGLPQVAYNTDGQRTAGTLIVPSFKQLELLELAPSHWTQYPIIPIRTLILQRRFDGPQMVVHVRGKFFNSIAGQPPLISDDTGSIPIEAEQALPPADGTEVEFIGHCVRGSGKVFLQSTCYRALAVESLATQKALPVLTTIDKVKSLSREEAQRGHPVHIRGILTAPLVGGFFLQDSTSAIYVSYDESTNMTLHAGDFWDVEGVTFAEFAPNVLASKAVRLGSGTLPEPVRPTWDQLLNGSLDTRYVEVQGVVTAVTPDGLNLLTRAGKLTVELATADQRALRGYENALIRARGCMMPARNDATQQVEPGRIRLLNYSVTVDQPAPEDPFSIPLKRAAELLLFDPRAGAMQAVKIAGQVIHASRGEYFLSDAGSGLRFIPKSPVELSLGDLVEVVGFPELGGPSPILRESVARRTGHTNLPPATLVLPDSLPSVEHEASLVRVQGLLANVSLNRSGVVLEMTAGPRNFIARLDGRRNSLARLRPGSRLELTGVYAIQHGEGDSGRGIDSFELLLNSPGDINVLKHPGWWTLRRLLAALGLMGFVLLLAMLWAFLLKRQVNVQTQVIRQKVETEAVMEERARIARELHDTLEQALAGTSLQLKALTSRLSGMPSETLRILEMARLMVRHGQEEARRTVRNLRQVALERADLPTALAQQAARCRNGMSAEIKTNVVGKPRPLPSKVESHLLRIGQEATTNAVKHAQARAIWLDLGYEDNRVRLAVRDNGNGFDAANAASSEAGHFGLLGMRERAEKIGGSLSIHSAPGQGTTVEVIVPLGGAEDESGPEI